MTGHQRFYVGLAVLAGSACGAAVIRRDWVSLAMNVAMVAMALRRAEHPA
jgi:hypothetical protein